MVKFNPDGSIKLPEQLAVINEENKKKMQSQRCMKIRREIVSFTAPKKCVLRITLSDAFNNDSRFIDTIYGYFKNRAAVPNKLTKINDKEFEVEIGTDFRRCTDCASLRNEFREFLYGNIIDEQGNCTFEGRKTNFSYEDYFD
ncbi:hypothetical protein HQ529_06385 [Candidatus Woesearchaeota archaeon]|nr:hypothetical protein [Candidatus Woesearchaeota archaeon]